MRDQDNIRAASALRVDLIGFIFWEKTPRNALSLKLPTLNSTKKVGVFVDERIENIIVKMNENHLDYIQLHGNESADYIVNLRQVLRQAQDKFGDVKIIKAISIREADDVKRWRDYEGHVDMLLFDTKCTSTMLSTGACVGGSGEQFDWSVLEQYDGDIPFLLSGGIGPDDAERIKAFHHPKCIGIDLNSKFEDAPGLKNIDKLRNFIKIIRNE